MSGDSAPVSAHPLDLYVVFILAIATGLSLFAYPTSWSLVRATLSFVFVLFVPGYAISAALFPRRGRPVGGTDDTYRGLDGLERLVVAVGMSVAVAVLVGLVLGGFSGGIRPESVLAALAAVTGLAIVPAAVRRRRVPRVDRPTASWLAGYRAVRRDLFDTDRWPRVVLNVVVVLLVLGAIGSVAYGVGGDDDSGITELYFLSTSDGNESAIAGPSDELPSNGTVQSSVVVQNLEGELVDYTLVVLLQRANTDGGEVSVVRERTVLNERFALQHDQSRRIDYSVTAPSVEGEVRLVALLYTGEPPANPTIDNAYREVHVWTTVSGANGTDQNASSDGGQDPSAVPSIR